MAWPVAISTDGNVSCGAVIWRFQRRLEVTVIVKATFTIVPDGTAILAGPGELTREDRTFDRHPSRSVEAASDLAPYLARCDVTFTGHACAPGGRPAPASSVRLGISGDARLLLDKTLHVFGDDAGPGAARAPFTKMPLVYERALGGPGELNPLGVETPNVVDAFDGRKPGGFGPISPFWPARKRLLGKLERRALDAPIAELPDPAPWDYFQAAPPDQQIAYLHGGEWLVLDGLHPQMPRVQTRLASARGAARILTTRRGLAPEESRVDLVCDSLAIDGDRQTLSVVWRGHFPVAGDEAALPTLRVLAGLEAPGAAVDWARLATDALAHEPAARVAPGEAVGEGTMAVDLEQVAHAAITPFEGASPSAAAAPVSVTATPWAQAPLRPAPAAGRSKATVAISIAIAAPTEGAGEATLALRPSQQADAESRPATPFAAGSEPVAAPSSSPGARIVGAPWSGVSAPSAPAPQVGEGTMMLRDASSPPAPVAPRAVVAPPAMMTPIAAPPALTTPIAPREMPAASAPSAAPPRPPEAPPRATAAPTPFAAPAKPEVKIPKAPPRDPDALASKLRTAGASAEDVAAMLQALRPPPPPPDDDD